MILECRDRIRVEDLAPAFVKIGTGLRSRKNDGIGPGHHIFSSIYFFKSRKRIDAKSPGGTAFAIMVRSDVIFLAFENLK